MSDQEIQQLENQFPTTSSSAFEEARRLVLDAGFSVLEAKDGVIYEVFPDGRRGEVKRIDPPVKVEAGGIYTIS